MASLAAGWRNGNVVQAITAPIYLRAQKNQNRLPSSRRQPNDGLWPTAAQRHDTFKRPLFGWLPPYKFQAVTNPSSIAFLIRRKAFASPIT